MNAGVDSRVYLGSGVTLIPAYAYSIFHQTGFSDIHRNTLSLNADYRPSRLFTASVGLGASLYDDDRQRLTSREALTVAPGHGFELGVAHEHLAIIDTEPPFRNPIYNYVVTLGAVGRKISSDDYTLNIVQRLRADLDAWGRFTYGDYSDGNRKLSWSLGMDYRPEPIHGLSLSYNYFYLDYADPAPVFTENTASVSAYYDPTNLEVHTLGVSYASAPTAPVRYGGQWNISYLPKSNGVANALFGFASLGLTKSQAIRLDVRYFYQDKGVGRTGTSGHFSAENVMLAYEYTF
ncbi:MAG TPA: hypothetical protein VIU41_07015, partial [Geobacteraceae bacterium]